MANCLHDFDLSTDALDVRPLSDALLAEDLDGHLLVSHCVDA